MRSGQAHARPWAAKVCTPGCRGHAPRLRLNPQRPGRSRRAERAIQTREGRDPGPGPGTHGHRARVGPGLHGTSRAGVSPNADHRPAPGSLLPRRTYPNLPPTASPSWRRANGAPCARKPRKRGRLPRATPEQKGTTLVRPELHTQPTQQYKDSKNLLWVTEVHFPRIIPIQIRRGRPIPSREVPKSTLVAQCILGLVVSCQ